MNSPILSVAQQRLLIDPLVREWLGTLWPHFEDTILNYNYPRLTKVFLSPMTIQKATDDDLFDALCTRTND